MTTSKTQPPLSFKFKLILGYLYAIVSITALAAVAFSFGPDDLLKEARVLDPAVRIATVIAYIVSTALYAWAIYLLHKRSKQTVVAFVAASLVSYGLSDLIGQSDMSVSTIIFSLTFLAVELAIALFLLQSKEAKTLLKNK